MLWVRSMHSWVQVALHRWKLLACSLTSRVTVSRLFFLFFLSLFSHSYSPFLHLCLSVKSETAWGGARTPAKGWRGHLRAAGFSMSLRSENSRPGEKEKEEEGRKRDEKTRGKQCTHSQAFVQVTETKDRQLTRDTRESEREREETKKEKKSKRKEIQVL